MSALVRATVKGGKQAYNFTSAMTSITKVAGKVDMGKLFKTFDVTKFAKKMDFAPTGFKKTSALFDTSQNVTKFAKAVPSSTDDILKNASKQVANVGEFTVDVGDKIEPKIFSKVLDSGSLSKIGTATAKLPDPSVVGSVTGIARKSADVILDNSALIKKVDNGLEKVTQLSDVSKVLKKGKGVSKLTQKAGDATSIAKKSGEAVQAAKKAGKVATAVKAVNKVTTLVRNAALLYYFTGMYLEYRDTKNVGEENYDYVTAFSDPGSKTYDNSLTDTVSVENTFDIKDLLQTKQFIIAVIVALLVLIL